MSAAAQDLRESSGYLRDEGWHATATMMELAAAEIERVTR